MLRINFSSSIVKLLTFAILTTSTTACHDEEEVVDNSKTEDVAESIVGKWLVSTSDTRNWAAYEITETSRINAETVVNGYYRTGTGYYSITGDQFSGSYTTNGNEIVYLDWRVTSIKPFELGIDVYDENVSLGSAALYRILGEETVEAGTPFTPDYRGYCGSSSASSFRILDASIATVSRTGEINGINEGITFVIFSTPNGTAALMITVSGRLKTFAEKIDGTWVYDVPAEQAWERYTFTADGYLSAQWSFLYGGNAFYESAQSTYVIESETVTFTVKSSSGQMNQKFVTEQIRDFDWTYNVYSGNTAVGKYTAQRLIESDNMEPGSHYTPNYQKLVGSAIISGYKSHNNSIATVEVNGTISAKANGRTYIDVITNKGTAVVEVNVKSPLMLLAFESCLGMKPSDAIEFLQAKPYSEDNEYILFFDYAPSIKTLGLTLDSWTGRVKSVVIIFDPTIDPSEITIVLDNKFVPFLKQTTDTFKAYMDTETRADASFGVTWDINNYTLTYVNLFDALFTDYSILLGMTKSQISAKMGRNPDYTNESKESYFFYDKKGVAIVSVYYTTDYEKYYDDSQAIVTTLDDTLSESEVKKYLNRKYTYYPEMSTDKDSYFFDNDVMLIYSPADKEIWYFPRGNSHSISSAKISSRAKKVLRQ